MDLATALAQSGDTAQAISEYQSALRLEPDSAATHMNLGEMFLRANRPPDAAKEFEEVLRLDPGNLTASAELAKLDYR